MTPGKSFQRVLMDVFIFWRHQSYIKDGRYCYLCPKLAKFCPQFFIAWLLCPHE